MSGKPFESRVSAISAGLGRWLREREEREITHPKALFFFSKIINSHSLVHLGAPLVPPQLPLLGLQEPDELVVGGGQVLERVADGGEPEPLAGQAGAGLYDIHEMDLTYIIGGQG